MASFHWADYIVFSISLLIGPALSIIFACTGGKQKTTDEYLLGNKDMNPITVGASLSVSLINAVFLLGGTAEVYYRGAIYGFMFLSYIPITIITCLFFIPSWRKYNVTSAYEFLQIRFDSTAVRLWGTFLFSFKLLLFLSVVFYTPAMALSQVIGINMHVSILVCGFLCAFYTCLGGIKAVIWTDSIQAIIMLIGMTVICVYGTITTGGFYNLLSTADNIGRFNFNNWSTDLHERHTVWSTTIGYTFTWLTIYLSDQTFVQRYQTVNSVRTGRWAMIIQTILGFMIQMVVATAGIVAAVYFKDCDPLTNGDINKGDQLLPFLFMSLLGPYHGLKGLFIASVFAAALSTVSSGINSLAAVYLEDIFKPLCASLGRPVDKKKEHVYAKILSGIMGFLSIGLSYLAPLMGPAIIQIPPTVMGVWGGPLFSLFFLGFYVPFADKWGAMIGSITGIAFGLWAGLGAIMYGPSPNDFNLPVGLCYLNATENTTYHIQENIGQINGTAYVEEHPLGGLYNLSYLWLSVAGLIISISVGILVSLLTSYLSRQKADTKTDEFIYLEEKKAFL